MDTKTAAFDNFTSNPGVSLPDAKAYAMKTFGQENQGQVGEFVAEWSRLHLGVQQFKADVDRIWPEDKYG